MAVKKKKAVTAPAPTANYAVYIGPTIRGIVNYGAIYQGSADEIRAALDAGIKKYPHIAALLIPGEQLAEARIKIKTPGNVLYAQYQMLLKELAQ